jgi:hypothetical protein
MAISLKVKVQEPRIEKTDPLARTLLASPLGATGAGRLKRELLDCRCKGDLKGISSELRQVNFNEFRRR